MLAPRWFKLRIGPYLRREKDKRNYHRLFTNGGYISGPLKLYYWARYSHVSEDEVVNGQKLSGRNRTLVLFYDCRGFASFRKHHELLLQELLKIVRRRYLRDAISQSQAIAVHVRRGDFIRPASNFELRDGQHNRCTPIEWYVDVVHAIRAKMQNVVPVVVFSDGTADELRPLLQQPNVRRIPQRTAIQDLLALSQASVLVGSGSGFSQWAGFLGQMPSLWYPGQRLQRTLDASPERADMLELEWDAGADLPDEFVDEVRKRWDAPSRVAQALRCAGLSH